MKRLSVLFLQAVVVLFALVTLALMLWEPHLEGRNVNATLYQIYFNDPFLAYVYIASIALYLALYKLFRLLGYIGRDEVFSEQAVQALLTIKYCALSLVMTIAGAEAYILIFIRGTDDITGGIAIGVFLIFITAVIATAASVFARLLQNAVEFKSENDLTV
jgi:hypothetical protein